MRIKITALAVAWLCSISLAAEPAAAEECFQVVSHADNETAGIDLETLSKIFLKRLRRWPDGTLVVPVDQKPGAPARQQFSRHVHGRSTAAVVNYWQRQIFSGGGVPPETLDTDQHVLDFVRRQPGAVGYVSCASLPARGPRRLELDRPLILALHPEPERAWLWLGQAPTESLLPTVVPASLTLARTAARSSHVDVRVLLTGTCGTGGQRVFLHSREKHDASVEVEHRMSVDGRLRHRTVRVHSLPPGGRRHLGCSNIKGVEHSHTFRKEP